MVSRVLQIDLSLPAPAYLQIAGGLRALLVSGDFTPGAQIPPVRRLAIELGVHHNTVAQAYRLLEEEGWLDLQRGRRATVRDRKLPRGTRKAQRDFARRLEQLVAEAIARGVPRGTVARQAQLLVAKMRG